MPFNCCHRFYEIGDVLGLQERASGPCRNPASPLSDLPQLGLPMCRSICLRASRSAIRARLSYRVLPLPTPNSSFARPVAKWMRSGTAVNPLALSIRSSLNSSARWRSSFRGRTGVVVELGRRFVRRDVHSEQIRLPAPHPHIAFPETNVAVAQRFDFRALQRHARIESLANGVVVPRPAIGGDGEIIVWRRLLAGPMFGLFPGACQFACSFTEERRGEASRSGYSRRPPQRCFPRFGIGLSGCPAERRHSHEYAVFGNGGSHAGRLKSRWPRTHLRCRLRPSHFGMGWSSEGQGRPADGRIRPGPVPRYRSHSSTAPAGRPAGRPHS